MVTPKRFTTIIPLISSLLLYLSSIYSLDDKREHLEAEKEQRTELILRGQICRVWPRNEISVLNGWILLHPISLPDQAFKAREVWMDVSVTFHARQGIVLNIKIRE